MEHYIVTFEGDQYSTMLRFPPKYPFGAKYILCETNGETFIVADALCENHKDIQKKYLNSNTKVLGGGCMYYYGRKNGFVLTGKSIIFGAADHTITKNILEKLYSSQVHISIEQ